MQDLQAIECPNCRGDASSTWAEESGFKVVRCGRCALLYVSPRPRDDLIADAVRSGVHQSEYRDLNVAGQRNARKVNRYRRLFAGLFSDLWRRSEAISWLDVGAGYGEVVEAVASLSPPGSRVRGLEPMLPKVENAQLRGLEVENAYLSSAHGPVDVISLVDVFSHIPDFNAFLATARAALREHGELFIETGNLADLKTREEFPEELRLPDHLVFAGETQLTQYLDRAGIDIIEMRRERFDTATYFAKSIVKKLIGRPVIVRAPYTSSYCSLHVRARKR